jgi:uncharacterized membrane protein YhiD involved in acid resistance
MRNKRQIKIFSLLAGVVLATVLVLFFSFGKEVFRFAPEVSSNEAVVSPATQAAPATSGENPFLPQTSANNAPKDEILNGVGVLGIVWRLFVAVVLAAILAFRPRKNVPLFRRNLYVAQTQILLAVVAAALMMIVGDNTARAFAIFAAVSLVRFRTNIRDPKEITVLLISLALGLAAGVGRWDLGVVLCLFALVLLQVLEYREPEQVFRSMELTVKTRNTDRTQLNLKKIFDRFRLESEVRQIDSPDESNPVGCIMYYLNLPLNLSTDYLSNTILDSDAEFIEGIQWEQKKDAAYIYQ